MSHDTHALPALPALPRLHRLHQHWLALKGDRPLPSVARPEAVSTTYHNALPLGSMLLEYRLESVLGAGGFGMTGNQSNGLVTHRSNRHEQCRIDLIR